MNSRILTSRNRMAILFLSVFIMIAGCQKPARNYRMETKAEKDARMQWWREARFGMFIHWGIYSVPAGVYGDVDTYGEWIMHHAQIPVELYEKYAKQFNPVQFDADQWVLMAKGAGMKYIVITSKHHDGFCLWDSEVGDYDIIDRTPYRKDILKALSKACKKHDIKLCFYHSIMDWHHEDYLPRRDWEQRPSEGADLQRYIAYMKAQLKELVTQYDPAVLWFDGEWEDSWTHEEGLKLYEYVRSLKPDIIINNRVDKGREGMQGLTKEGDFAGDFGTPEQEVPAGGLPRVDWESCITMNDHWGYCAADKNFKSTETLIHQLIEIVSKGGNYLLNVGPTSEGLITPQSVYRLGQMGQWMKVNSEAIYGTNPWSHERSAEEAVSTDVLFTAKDDAIYAITTKLPKTLAIRMPKPGDNTQVSLLGSDQEFSWKYMDGNVEVDLSEINKDTLPCDYAWVFKID